jgi:hypothetical protein
MLLYVARTFLSFLQSSDRTVCRGEDKEFILSPKKNKLQNTKLQNPSTASSTWK